MVEQSGNGHVVYSCRSENRVGGSEFTRCRSGSRVGRGTELTRAIWHKLVCGFSRCGELFEADSSGQNDRRSSAAKAEVATHDLARLKSCPSRYEGNFAPRQDRRLYSELMFARNSPFDLVLLNLSINNSIASTGESGFSTLRSTQMRVRSSFGISNSSLRVPER
jgi:hypothetical protein